MSAFSHTWWGERFIAALEEFTDSGRLSRGRTYARNGKVTKYELKGSTVEARVRGSINPYFGVYKEPLYRTTISFTPIKAQDWQRVLADLTARASFVTRLLLNEMPDSIDDAFGRLGVSLLPHDQRDITTDCSCPDWYNPCKHIAGVYYLLAADLDRDPFVLFELRGLPRQQLRWQLAESRLGRILAAEMEPRLARIEPAASYYSRPEGDPDAAPSYREFWTGKRLPPLRPAPPPAVAALLVKKAGDYPAFWPKDASFLATMEGLYERVRAKSPELKRT
jgi:uncharacterized Zn finger protein